MNKTDIEWCDRTWNPVTGCLHGCEYCYARGIARRFDGKTQPSIDYCDTFGDEPLYELYEKVYRTTKKGKTAVDIFPWGFSPTFHGYRLDAPQKIKNPQNVFVGSDADVFGEWVSEEWLKQVFAACEAAPWHRYLFLTKNPIKLPLSSYLFNGIFDKHKPNYWFGMSVTNQKSLQNALDFKHFININGSTFLSIEPLHEPIDLTRIDLGDVICNLAKGVSSSLFHGQRMPKPKWVIIGAETGSKNCIVPKREWIERIVNDCKTSEIAVFMKDSLTDIWGEPLLREFPWEV